MAISETILVLIINNSFLLGGAIAKYIADSECMKLVCCRGALEIENIHHINSELKQEADESINTMSSTLSKPIQIIQPIQKSSLKTESKN